MLPDQYFYSEDSIDKRELLPGVFARLVWGEKIMMGIIEIDPNVEVPQHQHPHEQCGRVLDGSAWFFVGDEKKLLLEWEQVQYLVG